ncbi:hypothetical protein ACLI09_05395 [Flavobacterium sp. RHBU_24]|uniref:hypothetical protein n=1 Tax=Flavobacterium sp. RHBU_24 TaxID=3391185 RepID=UPI00398528CB
MKYAPEIIFAIVVATILMGAYFFSKKAVVKRNLKKAPHKSLRQFRSGETARIIGTVECVGEPLIAPLSGRNCAHYYIHVQQHISSGKSGHWKTLIEEEVSGTFVLRDGDKCAIIKANDIKSYIVEDKKYASGFMNDPTENLKTYLKKHGHDSETYLGFNKKIRYHEGVLEPGEQTAVLGKGSWKKAYEAGLPDHYYEVLVITGNDKGKLYLSDDPDTVKKEFSV